MDNPTTPKDCRDKIRELIGQSQKLIAMGDWDSEEQNNISQKLNYLHDYGKLTWPDEFDERTFARVIDNREPHYGKIGQVGNWSHNCGDLHFSDGSVHSYHAMSLERVKSSPEIRAEFGEISLSKDDK